MASRYALDDIGSNVMGTSSELRAGPQTARQKFQDALMALAPAATWEVNGDDISVYQGAINWPVHAGKVDFSIIRFSYGNKGIDTRAEENVIQAREHSKPHAGYHYLKPALSWKENAANFAAMHSSLGGKIFPVGDLEESGGLNKTGLESWVYKWWNETEQKIGREVACYTSAGFLNTAMGLTNWLKNKKLFVAHWTSAGAPQLPNEWAIAGRNWTFWQHKIYKPGSDYGVQSGAIDLDRYNGTRTQFNTEFGIVTTPPPDPDPEPEPEPTGCLQMEVVQDGLRVRRGPGTSFAVVGSLAAGRIVDVLNVGGQDSWVEIAPGEWANVQQGSDVNMRKVS